MTFLITVLRAAQARVTTVPQTAASGTMALALQFYSTEFVSWLVDAGVSDLAATRAVAIAKIVFTVLTALGFSPLRKSPT